MCVGNSNQYLIELRYNNDNNDRPYFYYHQSNQSGKHGLISTGGGTTASNQIVVWINGTANCYTSTKRV